MLKVISIMRIIGQLLSKKEGFGDFCIKLTFLTGQMYTEMSFYHKDRQLLPMQHTIPNYRLTNLFGTRLSIVKASDGYR